MLEESFSEPSSTMRLALDVNSIEFIGNVRVARIMRRFWQVPLVRPPEEATAAAQDGKWMLPRFTFWTRHQDLSEEEAKQKPSSDKESRNEFIVGEGTTCHRCRRLKIGEDDSP